jgi:ABC-type uncharacterized transport system permease subunit
MQETSIFWLRVAAALYSIGLLHVLVSALRRHSELFPTALGCFSIGTVLHMVALVELWFAYGSLPANNFFESASLCGFLLAMAFLIVYWRYQFASLSVFIFPVVFFLTLLGATAVPVGPWTHPTVRDAWLLSHVLAVMLGYAALFLTAVASIFYLIKEKQLKDKRSGGLFERLPALGTLDNLVTKSLGFGFALLTVALITGSTWAFVESGTRWITEPKIGIAVLTWALCLVLVFLRTSAGWRGRRAAVMSIAVLSFSALTWVASVGLRSTLLR